MRVRQPGIIFFFALSMLVAILAAAATAQNHEFKSGTSSPAPKLATQTKSRALRLLTSDEGLAVLSAALESRANSDSESDCSHLVHAIYERAGFPYSYANSTSLYAGKAGFERVARPQPGDLVVWPGHVGIAVNPAQRSFFSALRSGLGVEPYDSPYWKERGRPRFLRYVTNAPAANRVAFSSGESNLKTVANPDSRPLSSRNMSYDVTLDSGGRPQTLADPARNVPLVAAIHSVRPTPSEATDALEQTFSETGERPRGVDMLNPSKPLMVFDQLSVERVHLQRDRGWAEVRIGGAWMLSTQKTNSVKHDEWQRWPILRKHDTWEVTIPAEAIYIRSDVAVRVLAHQLSALTDDTAGAPGMAGEKLQLSRLLNVFLEK
jgi:hypothetical protein